MEKLITQIFFTNDTIDYLIFKFWLKPIDCLFIKKRTKARFY